MELKNKKLYWALIGTFALLYLAVAFVSTLHAITFFRLANTMGLAILLGSAYEIGQAAVLFSILMTENKNRLLSWAMMLLLTCLQVTANVYASFKFMDSNGNDWTYWQRSILFWIEADGPEMYKIIISWISGALLPLVALGMTALVADNIRLARGDKFDTPIDDEDKIDEIKKEKSNLEEIIENEVSRRLNEEKAKMGLSYLDKMDTFPNREDQLNGLREKILSNVIGKQEDVTTLGEGEIQMIKPQKEIELDRDESLKLPDNFFSSPSVIETLEKKELVDAVKEFESDEFSKIIEQSKEKEIEIPTEIPVENIIENPVEIPEPKEIKKTKKDNPVIVPANKIQGWHLMKEFVDQEHNVFQRGAFIKNDPNKTPTLVPLKKA